MKTNIRHSIIGILFWSAGLSASLWGLVVLISDSQTTSPPVWATIFYGVLTLTFFVMLLHAINNIQWFHISSGYLSIHSPFGMINRVQLAQIKKTFKIRASVFEFRRSADIKRWCIVLCLKKSISKADIVDAYNARGNSCYIIIPYTEQTEHWIRSEYKNTCGEELNIK